jgi:uncharacterized protein GlcG (DUF336 family)
MSMNLEQALRVLEGAKEKARSLGIRCCFVVLDANGEAVATQRMDGARLTAAAFAQKKAFTALNFGRPTHETAQRFQPPDMQIQLILADARLLFIKGGAPVLANGQVIGAIGTSGGSGDQDLECCQAGLAAL